MIFPNFPILPIVVFIIDHFREAQGVSQNMGEFCLDIYGKNINQGAHYVPGPDNCQLCICDNGSPRGCKVVLCKPPQNCKSFQMGNSCCEFICLDDNLTNSQERGSDLGI
ncbi:integral membrane protein DGCR2/IDD-like [Lutzomyia longipalpis]|uniref:Putative secreted protein n=1 Tax=Lutzomyia longipalpis TaxID=7200 RepID=A0A7G3ANB1_LUTLO|nr:integral membrane protein DGCR2/IDD-like [Lutzomyia longipalpis]